nr:FHA domain-containing protein [Rhodopirellula sp. SM50]
MRIIITASSDVGSFGKRWVRDGQQLVVGRTDRSDWILDDPTVSSSHCIFKCDGREAWVQDLGSTNGTLVENQRIDQAKLSDGQSVKLGNVSLLIEIQDFARSGPVAVDNPPAISPSQQDETRTASGPSNSPLRVTEPMTPIPSTHHQTFLRSESSTPATQEQPMLRKSSARSLQLLARSADGHARRISLRAGQHAVLGNSEFVEMPMTTDGGLAPMQLEIRYEGGFCIVTPLVEHPAVILHQQPINGRTMVAPGEQLLVSQTVLTIPADPIEPDASANKILRQTLSGGTLFSGLLSDFSPQESDLFSESLSRSLPVVWPPHDQKILLRQPVQLFDWCTPERSPLFQFDNSLNREDAAQFIACPLHEQHNAINTLRRVARGQAGDHSVAFPEWSWAELLPDSIPTLLCQCPARTRQFLLSSLDFLLILSKERWYLLGQHQWSERFLRNSIRVADETIIP